jgi:aminoglycoside phosphotransferase (APT) family kinase protein
MFESYTTPQTHFKGVAADHHRSLPDAFLAIPVETQETSQLDLTRVDVASDHLDDNRVDAEVRSPMVAGPGDLPRHRLAVRLPRIAWATNQAAKEAEWLPRLASQLPLAVPVSIATGEPGEGYPYMWSIYEWLPGENANGTITDLAEAAVDLAGFIGALRLIDTADAPERPPGARGAPLAELDGQVRRSIHELDVRIDSATVLRVREESLRASLHRDEVWVHGDLLPGNLLVVEGRLSAVIDFGGLNVGDPACDLQPA